MKKEFKVGDVVRCYHNQMKTPRGETIGVFHGAISQIGPDGGLVVISEDCPGTQRYFHPKQCRKLIKKSRRRVWLNMGPTHHFDLLGADGEMKKTINLCYRPVEGYTEFIEVKPRRK